MNSKTQNVRRNSLLVFVGVVAQGGFRVLTNVLIGRAAGTVVLGQAAGLIAAAQVLTLLGPTSLAAAQTRFVASEGSEQARTAIVRHVRRRVLQVGALIIAAAMFVWGEALAAPAEELVALAGLASGLMAYALAKSHLLGLGRVRRLVASEVVTAALGLGLVLTMSVMGVRDIRLVWPVAASAWSCAVLMWLQVRSTCDERHSYPDVDKFAALGVLGTMVSAGFMQGSVLLAAKGIGGEQAGYYAAAFALATPLSLLTTSIGTVLFPAFAGSLSDSARTRHLLFRGLQVMIGVLVPPLVFVMFLSPEITRMVWGPEFTAASSILPVLICAIGFMGFGVPGSQALTSTGVSGMRTSVWIGALGASTGMMAWLLLVPRLGVQGVGIGYAVGAGITSLLPMIVMARRLGLPWVDRCLRGWIVLTLASLVSVLLILHGTGLIQRVAGFACVVGVWGVLTMLHAEKPRLTQEGGA